MWWSDVVVGCGGRMWWSDVVVGPLRAFGGDGNAYDAGFQRRTHPAPPCRCRASKVAVALVVRMTRRTFAGRCPGALPRLASPGCRIRAIAGSRPARWSLNS
jgi:hypothetical protein